MSLISALVSGVSGIRAAASGTSVVPWGDNSWPGFWGGYGSQSAAGMRVTPATSKRLAAVFSCVQKKATAIAMLPCKIYQDDGEGGRSVVRNHPLYDVLKNRPNEQQTGFEFKQMMQAHVELRGNAFAEILPGPRGAVDQLIPMHPDRVQVEQLVSGRLRYRYNDPLTSTTRILMEDEVFHLRWMPDVIGVGQSRIALACDAIGLGLAQQDYSARFLANDATPGAFIVGTNFKTDEDEDEFVESLQRARTGKNRGRPYLLPPGVDMKTLGVKPVDQELLDASKATDVRICSIFEVLPHVVGIDAGKSATFASTEQFNLMHVQQTVLPMAIMWEEAIQRCLITNDRYYAKFSLASLMRGDAESRALFYHEGSGDGWLCADEIREFEDMNPIPGGWGQKFWNPLNWGRIDRPMAAPSATPPSSSGGNDVEDDGEEDDPADDVGSEDDSDTQASATVRAVARRRKRMAAARETMLTIVKHGRTRPRAA